MNSCFSEICSVVLTPSHVCFSEICCVVMTPSHACFSEICSVVMIPSLTCFSEILRVVDSLQLTMYQKVATPANWKVGALLYWVVLLFSYSFYAWYRRSYIAILHSAAFVVVVAKMLGTCIFGCKDRIDNVNVWY